jgi:hypothetical protein
MADASVSTASLTFDETQSDTLGKYIYISKYVNSRFVADLQTTSSSIHQENTVEAHRKFLILIKVFILINISATYSMFSGS